MRRRRLVLVLGLLLIIAGIAACQLQPSEAPTPVVVTRIVTETVEGEQGTPIVVTQIVEVPVTVAATAEPETADEPSVLRIGTILDEYRFDPEVPTDITVGMGNNSVFIFENLTRMDANFQLQPWLATSWGYDTDRGVWVFDLRDDVSFHDGVPLTAEHVAEHMNFFAQDSFMKGLLEIEENAATAVGDYTLEIRSDNAQLPFNASHMTMGIRRGDPFAGEHIGTGPFRFVEYEPDSHIIVERNPNYWGESARVDRLEMTFIPDPVTRMLSLQAGEVDIIYDPPREALAALQGREDITLHFTEPASHQQLDLIVTGEAPFDILQDVLVREALGYAINRQEVIDVGWGGFAVESQTLVAPALLGESASLIEGYTYDAERASSLLEEAGWVDSDGDGIREKDGRRLSLTMVNGWPNAVENGSVPEVLQAQFAAAGVELEIIPVPDFPSLDSYLTPKQADILLEIWTNTSPSPCLIPRFGFYGGEEEPNSWQAALSPAFIGFEEINEEFDNCSAATTQQEAVQWAAEALHTVFDEARTSIGLVGLYRTWATSDRVTTFEPHPIQGYVQWHLTELAP